MDARLRKLLRDVYETGFARGVLARDEGDVVPGMPAEVVEAAVQGASAEWLVELDESRRQEAA